MYLGSGSLHDEMDSLMAAEDVGLLLTSTLLLFTLFEDEGASMLAVLFSVLLLPLLLLDDEDEAAAPFVVALGVVSLDGLDDLVALLLGVEAELAEAVVAAGKTTLSELVALTLATELAFADVDEAAAAADSLPPLLSLSLALLLFPVPPSRGLSPLLAPLVSDEDEETEEPLLPFSKLLAELLFLLRMRCRTAPLSRGSVNCVVRFVWFTKYGRPVAVSRLSQPEMPFRRD